jgi:hypothetical protein
MIAAKETVAHVQLDYPVGGETFVAGETVKIEWQTIIMHDQKDWDLYFSSDGGDNWVAIQLDIETSRSSYFWTVPENATETGRVQIVQDNTGADYIGESGDFIIQTAAGLDDHQDVSPDSYALFNNFPNPFNPTTAISYRLSAVSNVELSVYNVLGQKIVTLVSENQHAGSHQVEWDASGFASGIYYYQLRAGEFVAVKNMVLLR